MKVIFVAIGQFPMSLILIFECYSKNYNAFLCITEK